MVMPFGVKNGHQLSKSSKQNFLKVFGPVHKDIFK
jgi:hypothetical protein